MNIDSLSFIGCIFSILCVTFCQDSPDGELVSVHVVSRHGARIPSTIDPNQIPLWEQIGYNTIYKDGDITRQGLLQLQTLGTWFRREYVEKLGFLPREYFKDSVSARASSQSDGRNLESTEAFFRGLYPRASIPIYSTLELNRELIFLSTQCDSFEIEREPRHKVYDADVTERFPELIENVTQVVGFPPLLPHDLFTRTRDNIEQELSHDIPSHPYLLQNSGTISVLAELAWQLVLAPINDPGGGAGPHIAYFLLDNIQESLRDNGARLYVYGSHGGTLMILDNSLGLPFQWYRGSDTFLLEVRRHEDGRVFLNAKFVGFEPHNGLEVVTKDQPLMCPNSSLVCELDAFSDFIELKNPKGPGKGCCRIGRGFYAHGCSDYFNPDVALIPECLSYRVHCPEVACGVNGVVDKATNLCVLRGTPDK